MEVSAYATLPDTVRGRIVALTAGALPDVVRLPPALKRIADFAPARRAKAGGAMIASVLAGDDEVRASVGNQLRATYLTEGAEEITLPEEPAEAAAVAWLVRPDGWEIQLKEALDRLEAAAVPAVDAEVARLRGKLTAAEDEIREVRADRKARLDDLKADNTTLRRKLGEARAAARDAGAGQDEALSEARAALARAEDELASRDRQVRQLRSQVEKMEREAATERRTSKTDREDASLRARFLLDTLLDAATGLRRELALPPVTGTPGERIEAELASTDAAAAGSGVTSSAHLEQFLAMPRVRLLVDGYNISKALWPDSALDAQRLRLLRAIAPIAARTGAETTVVFDAHSASVRPTAVPPRGVKVLFSPEGVIADDVIRDLVDAEPAGRVILVATDDAEIVKDVRRAGARTVPLSALSPLLG